jgi:hypothetical protein
MEKNVIVLEGMAADWYFNFEKNTFILWKNCDLSKPAYTFEGTEIPAFILVTLIEEFTCTIEYASRNLLIQTISL